MRRPQPKREPKEDEMDADDEFPDAKDSDFIKVRALANGWYVHRLPESCNARANALKTCELLAKSSTMALTVVHTHSAQDQSRRIWIVSTMLGMPHVGG